MKTFNRFRIDRIDKRSKVEDLKRLAAEKFSLQVDNFELAYHGLLLEPKQSLDYYNMERGSDIYVLEKNTTNSFEKPLTEVDIQNAVSLFRCIYKSPATFRTVMTKAIESDFFEAIISKNAQLRNCPILPLIEDPDLLTHFIDPSVVRSIGQKHPQLIRAICLAIKNTQSNVSGQDGQTDTSSGFSYSMEALSDDDDDDDFDSNSSARESSYPISRNFSFNAITAAQLSAAIASVTNNSSSLNTERRLPSIGQVENTNSESANIFSNSKRRPSSPQPSSSSQSSPGSPRPSTSKRHIPTARPATTRHLLPGSHPYEPSVSSEPSALVQQPPSMPQNSRNPSQAQSPEFRSGITTEMFTDAIHQAMNFTPTTSRAGSSVGSEFLPNEFTPQLLQMREMGFFDQNRNIRALQASSGNLQQALELLFNNVID